MIREVITISLGQGGIQLNNAVQEQYLAEHDMNLDGTPQKDFDAEDRKLLTFFEEIQGGSDYVPRQVSVDLEPTVLDDIRTSTFKDLYYAEDLINSEEDAAENFARGHYTVGKEMIGKVNDLIRAKVENADNVQGFVINHAVGGGTGSGLGVLTLERLAVDYRKKPKVGYEIYPSNKIATSIVAPYNALLTTHHLLDFTEVSVCVDNEQCYKLCMRDLGVKRPTYKNVNRIIAKVISSMTASLRFDGELNTDMNDFPTNLVPFPRLHFLTSSIAPCLAAAKKSHEKFDVQTITDMAVNPVNFTIEYPDYVVEEDKYMAITMNYRGNIKYGDANTAAQFVKGKKAVFIDWMPTGIKCGMNDEPPCLVQNDDLADSPNNCVMIGNNVAISRVFTS